jgi:hypothetical protein
VADIRSDGQRQFWSNAAPQGLFYVEDPKAPPPHDGFWKLQITSGYATKRTGGSQTSSKDRSETARSRR